MKETFQIIWKSKVIRGLLGAIVGIPIVLFCLILALELLGFIDDPPTKRKELEMKDKITRPY